MPLKSATMQNTVFKYSIVCFDEWSVLKDDKMSIIFPDDPL